MLEERLDAIWKEKFSHFNPEGWSLIVGVQPTVSLGYKFWHKGKEYGDFIFFEKEDVEKTTPAMAEMFVEAMGIAVKHAREKM